MAESRTAERSIVSRWSIQNAVDTRPEIKRVASFVELSNDQIVAKLQRNLEIVFDESKQDLHKIALYTSTSDDGNILLSAIFESYVELLADEEIRIWAEEIAEVHDNIGFFEKVLDKPPTEASAAMRELTEESLRKDRALLTGLEAGFDEKVSSISIQLSDVSETQFDYGKLIGWSVIPILLPLLIGLFVLGIWSSYIRKALVVSDQEQTPRSRTSIDWSVSNFLLPLVFALGAVLISWIFEPATYSSSVRIRIEPKAVPLSTPTETFNGMLDLLKREPFKTKTLKMFLHESDWVTSLDQYSCFKVDPDATQFYAFQQDSERALERVLSDNLEWIADERGPGFFDVTFSSADPNDTTLVLQTIVQSFRKAYSTSLDVSYVGKPPERAQKVMNLPLWRMIIFGFVGLMLGCVCKFLTPVFREMKVVES